MAMVVAWRRGNFAELVTNIFVIIIITIHDSWIEITQVILVLEDFTSRLAGAGWCAIVVEYFDDVHSLRNARYHFIGKRIEI